MALRFYGVTLHDGHAATAAGAPPSEDGVEMLPFRDLAAIVATGEYVAESPSGEQVERHRRVVEGIFRANHAVLPAPPGAVFRTREVLVRWLELHYVALSDALAFVDDRGVARVHVLRSGGRPDEREAGADIAAAAAEAFRSLRRHAVAAVPLRLEHLTGIVLSAAYLVDMELWNDFMASVDVERGRNAGLRFEVSGPWPPFDFVRMQFGG